MKKYVICGFFFDEDDAKGMIDELKGKIAGLELIELEGDDRIARWSDVKDAVKEVTMELLKEGRFK